MGWGKYGDKGPKGSGVAAEFVREGNVDLFVFTEERTKVRFLTEDLTVDQVMSDMKLTREEAEDFFYTKASKDRWIIPMSYWEHRIKEIPNKRFFSTVLCRGRGNCSLCDENDAAKGNGVSENKFLPYPVSRKFIVPAWIYPLKRVLFVRAAEKFFDSVSDYLDRNGPNSDFEIYKVGRGLDTEYKAVFLEKGTVNIEVDRSAFPVPNQVQLWPGDAEFKRRLEGGKSSVLSQAKPALQEPAATQDSARSETVAATEVVSLEAFKLPFGQFKGLTFEQVMQAGNGDYIKFLAENSAGIVQKEARKFMGLA